MRPARILLLVVAIIAGGLAAFLATRGNGPTVVEQVVAPQPASKTQVLVAKQPIGVGERLSAAAVEWQPWPEDAVRPEYITIAKSPDAPTKIVGAVARFEIFQGEPILDGKLAHSDQGYLSAVLAPGMRGVSVNVSAPSASGGFIIPNDRVDVLVTDSTQGATVTSRVVLSDVKVLAIGTRLGQSGATGAPADPADPKSQVFTADAIATLELTPAQAQTLITSTSTGKISLVLRSVADFGRGGTTASVQGADDNQTIKVIRFGRLASVMPGSSQQPSSAVATPVAYVPPATATTTDATVTTSPAVVVTEAAPAAATPTSTPSAPAASSGSTTPAPQVQMAPTIQ